MCSGDVGFFYDVLTVRCILEIFYHKCDVTIMNNVNQTWRFICVKYDVFRPDISIRYVIYCSLFLQNLSFAFFECQNVQRILC